MPRICTLVVVYLSFAMLCGAASGQTPSAAAPALKPLETVLSELRVELDLTKAAYFFKRCSGYSFATSKLLQESGGDKLKERSTEWRKAGLDLIRYAVSSEMTVQKSRSPNSRKSEEEWGRETLTVALEFANLYIDRMNANYLRSGSYVFDDPWLRSEHGLCLEAPKRVMDSFK
jgi:hypothetical protein